MGSRNYRFLSMVPTFLVTAFLGCWPSNQGPFHLVAEGVIYSVEYQLEDGHTEGFTRVNNSKAAPGGYGSWNVDAYGKLTGEFLLITRPQHKDLGPQVIPVSRSISLQFGDGRIREVKENQPAPAH